MKRIIFTVLILLVAGSAVYAQQSGPVTMTPAQVRQEAQQLLNQSRSNASQYEDDLADVIARNSGNHYYVVFTRLRNQINQLETMIESEHSNIENRLNVGQRISADVVDRFERMVGRHGAKVDELEEFVSE